MFRLNTFILLYFFPFRLLFQLLSKTVGNQPQDFY